MIYPEATSWLVRMDEEAVNAAGYGDIIQAVVTAETQEEAIRLGSEVIGCRKSDLEANQYSPGG